MKIFKSLFIIGLVTVSLVACKQNTADETKETKNTETVETKSETKEEVAKVQVLNANLATEANLKSLGLSDEMVSNIIENRPFLTMVDFTKVLGDLATPEMYAKIFVPMNLNTTPEDDFKIIPGVGNKMAHEFEEYRPYVSIAEFRKEIGKYVDEDVVENYLNYVFVPVELNTASEATIKALPGVGSKIAHEFEEYRPYKSMAQFRKELGKYVDDKELKRLERLVYLK